MAGVDLVTVQKILGHKDIETTFRYAHLALDHLKLGVNKGSLWRSSLKSKSETLTPTITNDAYEARREIQPVDSIGRPTGLNIVSQDPSTRFKKAGHGGVVRPTGLEPVTF